MFSDWDWAEWSSHDTTDAELRWGGSDGDFGVAILTPVSSPGVTDEPVLKTGLCVGTIAGDDNSVVSRSATGG